MATSLRAALVVGFSLVIVVLAGFAARVRWPVETVQSSSVPAGLAAMAPVAPAQPSIEPPPIRGGGASLASAPSAAPQPASVDRTVAPAPPAETPQFDIVRVEPSGDTVVAGKGAPNAKVALLSRGAVVAETMTDASGNFVVLPPSLVPGDHSLSLRQTPAVGPASSSAQSVTVSVPKLGKGPVVVALAEAGQPTKVLSAPDAPAPTPGVAPSAPLPATVAAAKIMPSAGEKVAVRAVDLENGDGFHASGIAKPGTPLHLYLNNAHVADVVAGVDGQWTMTIKKGLAGGHYVVRADAEMPDQAKRKGSTVTARAEVPFDVPPAAARTAPVVGKPPLASSKPSLVSTANALTTEASASPPDARQPPATRSKAIADAGNAVIEEIQTARVVTGDNLWNISLSRLGQAQRYTQIYAANNTQIRDPNLIYPGQVFVMPR